MPAQEQHSASPNDVKPGPLLANVLGTASPRSKLRSPQWWEHGSSCCCCHGEAEGEVVVVVVVVVPMLRIKHGDIYIEREEKGLEIWVKGICGGLHLVARGCGDRTCPTVHLRYLSDTYELVSLSPNPFEKDFSSTSTK